MESIRIRKTRNKMSKISSGRNALKDMNSNKSYVCRQISDVNVNWPNCKWSTSVNEFKEERKEKKNSKTKHWPN